MNALKGENKFLKDRMRALQRQLETFIDNSTTQQRYLREIKKLRTELRTNKTAISQLGGTLGGGLPDGFINSFESHVLNIKQTRSSSPTSKKKRPTSTGIMYNGWVDNSRERIEVAQLHDKKVKFTTSVPAEAKNKPVKSSY